MSILILEACTHTFMEVLMVKVYSTPTCPWCDRVKEYFHSNNISFEELNVAQDRDAALEMIEKTGQTGVPVIDIDGNIIVGFDKTAIDQQLGL